MDAHEKPVAREIEGHTASMSIPAEARALLLQGKTIDAIRVVRETQGLGMKEAKDVMTAAIAQDPALQAVAGTSFLDLVGLGSLARAWRGIRAPATQVQPARERFGGLPDPGVFREKPAELSAAAMAALDRGSIIDAIKIARGESGTGLSEAKALVDAEIARRTRV